MPRRLLVLFFVLFVAMIGFGVTLPALPFFVERLALGEGASEQAVALHVGMLTCAYALMQLICAPLWGRWSDRHGRKPLLVLGLGGYAIAQGIFGTGTSLLVLYGTRLLGGIFSGGLLTAAAAYIADTFSGPARGRAVAWQGTALSLGFVAGPILSGRVAPWRQVAFGFGFLGTGMGLLLVVQSLLHVLTAIGVLAIGVALNTPNLLTLAADRSGERIGAGIGLQQSFASLGQTAGPIAGGVLYGWQTDLPFGSAAAGSLLVAAVLWYFVRGTPWSTPETSTESNGLRRRSGTRLDAITFRNLHML